MATKSKSWTARRPVKICCWILIPITAFMTLLGAIGILRNNFQDLNILFADIYDNNYFYEKNIPVALSLAQTVFLYKSEEYIRAMGCLEWRATEENGWSDEGGLVLEKRYSLYTKYMYGDNFWREWGSVKTDDLESPEVKRLIDEAINAQLDYFEYAKTTLAGIDGLYYMITDGDRMLTNLVIERDADFFRGHPVYFIKEIGGYTESSGVSLDRRNDYYYDYGSNNNMACYIAFSQTSVDEQNAVWYLAQRELYIYISLITGSCLAFLLLLIILIAGAGRRYGDENYGGGSFGGANGLASVGADGRSSEDADEHPENAGNRSGGAYVHLTALDKPWLDFSLAALIAYEALICYGFYVLVEIAWRYNSIPRILTLCALMAVLFTIPLTGWLIGFSKRCKAGKWWRHTAVYAVPHKLFDGFRRFAKSLWAGFSLTLKAVLLGVALFFGTVLCALPDSPEIAITFCVLLAALAVFGLLRYARRLYLVEQGARKAGGGIYGEPIAVAGGELGSIAASINSISIGINAAVAERMKSERLKTELITNISHDIRTPLTSMITYADLLKNEGLDNAKAPEYLDILIQKSARLKTLTDDLFEASKAASGNVETHIETLDLADFVRQVLGELDERVRESGLDFRQNLPERAPVGADGKLLWRVVENLLSNVFKYAAPGSRVYIDVAPEDDSYRLDIKNISEHPLNIDPSELTERFKRGDSARSGDGSGLGLSIAQSFTQAQGGMFALAIDGDLFKATIRLPKR